MISMYNWMEAYESSAKGGAGHTRICYSRTCYSLIAREGARKGEGGNEGLERRNQQPHNQIRLPYFSAPFNTSWNILARDRYFFYFIFIILLNWVWAGTFPDPGFYI